MAITQNKTWLLTLLFQPHTSHKTKGKSKELVIKSYRIIMRMHAYICAYRVSEICSVVAQQADDYCILYCIHDPHCEGMWLQINILLARRVSLYVWMMHVCTCVSMYDIRHDPMSSRCIYECMECIPLGFWERIRPKDLCPGCRRRWSVDPMRSWRRCRSKTRTEKCQTLRRNNWNAKQFGYVNGESRSGSIHFTLSRRSGQLVIVVVIVIVVVVVVVVVTVIVVIVAQSLQL